MARIDDVSERFKTGLAIRREVLGADYVDKSLNSASDFTWVGQTWVTEGCWGDLWSRPGLERRDRSIINLSILTALNRMHEFGVHVRAAINNGLTPAEIQEILLQTAVYCGVPAALESFRVAERVLTEMGLLPAPGASPAADPAVPSGDEKPAAGE